MTMGAFGARGVSCRCVRRAGDLAVRSFGRTAAADVSRLRLILGGARTFDPDLGRGVDAVAGTEGAPRRRCGDRDRPGGGRRPSLLRPGTGPDGARVRGVGRERLGAPEPGHVGAGSVADSRATLGATSSRVESLWARQDTAGLAATGPFDPGRRLNAELGYGLGTLGGRGITTPYAGFTLSDGDARVWRLDRRMHAGPPFTFQS